MAIDYSKLRSLTARKLIRALNKDGFVSENRKGSTLFFVHPDGRTTTLHVHNLNQELPVGTLKSIIERQVRWTEDDLKRLKLLK